MEENENEYPIDFQDTGVETQDYIVSEGDAEYVSTKSSDVEYINNAQVSDGTDFDYPQTYPPKPTVPFEDPLSEFQMNYAKEVDSEFAPTKAVGMTQDVFDLAKKFSSNADELAKAEALQDFSKKQLDRFTSPKVIGPLLLFYAYRGKLSYVERALWGAIGLGAAMNAYGMLKPNEGLRHPMIKDVKARVIG